MSIAEAITNAQNKVQAVYNKCEEKGATIPETKDLANLPETIDSIPAGGGDVVEAYVAGVNLWKPRAGTDGWVMTSVSDVEVLLTKVGYQATGSETLSPSVRISLLTENGYAAVATNQSSYVIKTDSTHKLRYDIVNGVVDANSGYRSTNGTIVKRGQVITWFYKKGNVVVEGVKNSGGKMGFDSSNGGFVFYTYDVFHCGNALLPLTECTVLTDDGYISNSTSNISLIIYKDDNIDVDEYESFNLSDYLTGCVLNTDIFGISDGDTTFYIYYPKDSNYQNWELAKCVLNREDGTVTTSSLFTNTLSSYTSITGNNGNLVFECKGRVNVEGGFNKYLICSDRYVKFYITPNGIGSIVEINSYPQNIIDEIGDRTIHKMQCFYDNTFSFDLSDGTTLICGFSSSTGEPEIQEIVEPFIVGGDSNVYHRTFTANKIYWYQRPEGETASTSSSSNKNLTAPTSSNPYGPYNATKSTVDYLAVPREDARWNTTVLTGVIREDAQTAKPVFDETNRRVIEVETVIKSNTVSAVFGEEWTKEDLDKVNSLG